MPETAGVVIDAGRAYWVAFFFTWSPGRAMS
jgi:hypothetical protein